MSARVATPGVLRNLFHGRTGTGFESSLAQYTTWSDLNFEPATALPTTRWMGIQGSDSPSNLNPVSPSTWWLEFQLLAVPAGTPAREVRQHEFDPSTYSSMELVLLGEQACKTPG
jgi:hypothetical protein